MKLSKKQPDSVRNAKRKKALNIALAIHAINTSFGASISPIGQGEGYLPSGYYSREEITNCYTTGNISVNVNGATDYSVSISAGGVVSSATYIENCYNMVDIDIDVNAAVSDSSSQVSATAFGVVAGLPIFKNQSVMIEPGGGDDGETDIEPKDITIHSDIINDNDKVIIPVWWGLDFFKITNIMHPINTINSLHLHQ